MLNAQWRIEWALSLFFMKYEIFWVIPSFSTQDLKASNDINSCDRNFNRRVFRSAA